MTPPAPLPPEVKVGHIHLKVSDLERSLDFYRDALGFTVTQRYGREAVFLSAGGYHHHIGLNTWEGTGGGLPPPPGATGLHHVAFLYPTRRDLAAALKRLLDAGIKLGGAADHGVSEALYLTDADGNDLELYWDRPQASWPVSASGELAMYTDALDIDSLLMEARVRSCLSTVVVCSGVDAAGWMLRGLAIDARRRVKTILYVEPKNFNRFAAQAFYSHDWPLRGQSATN